MNDPTAANIALLILGYLNEDFKLYFLKFGDESLGWFPLHIFKGVYICVLTHPHEYTEGFFKQHISSL